jgi:hypothetical protein
VLTHMLNSAYTFGYAESATQSVGLPLRAVRSRMGATGARPGARDLSILQEPLLGHTAWHDRPRATEGQAQIERSPFWLAA